MINLIEELERVRELEDQKKAQMARRMGANSLQQYNNWVYRNSLPEEWEERAIEILREAGSPVALDAEIIYKLQRLPRDKAQLIIELINGMLGEASDQ